MELVTVKNKFQIVIPQSIREQAHIGIGDLLEASIEGGKITFTPKTVVDRNLAEALQDVREERTHGPYGRQAPGFRRMKLRFTERADKDYATLEKPIRKALAKQLGFLLETLNHPSIHAKKYSETEGVWQGRVNRSWRFYFLIQGDEYIILSIVPHPK
jgi:AbrB family looped-hinge helix DNA binding protein